MVSQFMNFLGLRYFPFGPFWSYLLIFFFPLLSRFTWCFSHILLSFNSVLLCLVVLTVFSMLLFMLLLLLSNSFFLIYYYYFTRDVRQPLSQIRLSVSISLGAGQIIFLAGINAIENKVSILSFYPWNEGTRWEYENSFFSQAACVTIAALMQYFLMAAFCWMLIEGIYLYFFVVKVYNINTKMCMSHVISWGKLINLKHALVTVTMLLDRQIWCCRPVKCFDLLPFSMGRSSSDHGGHFTRHRCWERRVRKLYEW